MPRYKDKDQKERWAAYMREYRRARKAKEGKQLDQRGSRPTAHQIAILKAYADPVTGGNQAKVAEQFGISKSAVNNAIQRLMKRLGVSEPSQAVMKLWVMEQNGSSEEVSGSD